MSQIIYLGPTMSGQGVTITTGSIYNGQVPPDIAERKQSDKDFSALFVSVDNVAEARIEIRKGNTFLSRCYENVINRYINGKKGA